MKEFDDVITQLQLVKNRFMSEELCATTRPLNAMETYKHLVCTTLYTSLNKTKLSARIREVYQDLLQILEDGETPSLYDIVEVIDEENTAILYTFYETMHVKSEDFDNVIAHYVQDISCMLDDWIEEILHEDGYYFTGMTLMKMFERNHDKVSSLTDGDAQNIVNPEWPR